MQIQLREPPERVAADRGTAPHRLAIDVQLSQPLDPGVLPRGCALLGLGIEIIAQSNAAGSRSAVDQDEFVVDHAVGVWVRAVASSTDRAAVNTLSVVRSARQS